MKLRFNVVVVLLCLAYLALEWNNGRAQMADFRVYYDAADALVHGDTLYGKAFGVSSGFYKYSPFACLPFIPLTFLPYAVASVLYYLLLTAALIFFLWRVTEEVSQGQLKQRLAIAALSGLLLIDHLERELHLGNINLFLLILLFEVYRLLIRKKDWQAGALYGLILLFKPHFLLLLPYLLWKRKLRAAGATVLSVIIGLLLPALGVGWNENLRLLQFWGFTIGDHNVALQHSPNTFYGLMNHAFLGGVAGPILIVVVLALVAAGIAGWLIYNDRRHGKTLSTDIRYEEYFLLIGLVPNLVHTDTEHFMWVWPMLVLAVCAALNTKANYRVAIICLLALAFIPFAVNSPDIVGKHWQLLFDEGGLGVANVLILVAAMIVARSENHSIRLTA
jgi:alpha-1,2-mannosyltransferase